MKFKLLFLFLSISISIFGQIIDKKILKKYVEQFNMADRELYKQYIPNESSFDFLIKNIPLFECPDKTIEEIYYFRWWTYRKHIRSTPEGFIITEFLPDVPWAGKYNGISCPAWFHFREGRWLHDHRFLDDYANYWLKGGGSLRTYSFPIADALNQYSLVLGDDHILDYYYDELKENYFAWKKENYDPQKGLFWQIDGKDGMEVAIGGSGYRVTINSYMCAELSTLSKIISKHNKEDVFSLELDKLHKNMVDSLWDKQSAFFKVMPLNSSKLQNVLELHGYTPWAFDLLTSEFDEAWKYLMDSRYFFAPYGLTTAEQCHPDFKISYQGHECQWNGPSWPFATSMTLTAMSNLLNREDKQKFVTKRDFYVLISIFARSQFLVLEDGQRIPWIDENLNPFTGDWIARSLLKERKQLPEDRGSYYNHSSFCDLIISGLIGLRPQEGNVLSINPLLPDGVWDYFCLDNVLYHGKRLTILYDKTGQKYNKGKGFILLVDGIKKASCSHLQKIDIQL